MFLDTVQVYIFNPRTNNWEWVNGIVKGIIFNKDDADFFAVSVQFERVTNVETCCDYKYIGNRSFALYSLSFFISICFYLLYVTKLQKVTD